jgi:ABC-type transport system involved in multi-copper enzyme maturation permease subunit
MVLAIVRKELRETRLFAALALGLYLIYLIKLTREARGVLSEFTRWLPGTSEELPDVPFVQDYFLNVLFLIGVPLAIALGFRQSAWEPSQGTAQYLLHLPLHRRTIFLTKLGTGIGLLLVCMVLPIVIYAAWAAAPGTHPGPFEWSMTAPALRLSLLMPLAYLGAFASGIRPARWVGSRLLPLFAVSIPGIISYSLPLWWSVGLPLALVVAAALVSDILWEAGTRDF